MHIDRLSGAYPNYTGINTYASYEVLMGVLSEVAPGGMLAIAFAIRNGF